MPAMTRLLHGNSREDDPRDRPQACPMESTGYGSCEEERPGKENEKVVSL